MERSTQNDRRLSVFAAIAALAFGKGELPNIQFKRPSWVPGSRGRPSGLRWFVGLIAPSKACKTCGGPLTYRLGEGSARRATNGTVRHYCNKLCRLLRHNKKLTLKHKQELQVMAMRARGEA